MAHGELRGSVPERLAAGAELAQVGAQPFLAQQALRLAMGRRREGQHRRPAGFQHIDLLGGRERHAALCSGRTGSATAPARYRLKFGGPFEPPALPRRPINHTGWH